MIYIAIGIIVILAFILYMIELASEMFWLLLAGTVLAWVLSFIFQLARKYEPFRFFYDLFLIGRIIVVVMFVALLIIRLFLGLIL